MQQTFGDLFSDNPSFELQTFSFPDVGKVLLAVDSNTILVDRAEDRSDGCDAAESYYRTADAHLCGFSFQNTDPLHKDLDYICTASTRLKKFSDRISFDDLDIPSPNGSPTSLTRQRVKSLPLLESPEEFTETSLSGSPQSPGSPDSVNDNARTTKNSTSPYGLRVSGRANIGSTLTCVVSKGWILQHAGCNKCHFQWYRCTSDDNKVKIVGAKFPKYEVTADDVGCRLQVVAALVLGRGRIGPPQSALSDHVCPAMWPRSSSHDQLLQSKGSTHDSAASTPPFSPAGFSSKARRASLQLPESWKLPFQDSPSESPVSVYGEGKVGTVLVVAAPTWQDGSGEGLESRRCRIQWLRGSKEGDGSYSFTKIAGAKTPRYTVVKEDLGCRIRVVAAPVLSDGQVGRAYTALSKRIME